MSTNVVVVVLEHSVIMEVIDPGFQLLCHCGIASSNGRSSWGLSIERLQRKSIYWTIEVTWQCVKLDASMGG